MQVELRLNGDAPRLWHLELARRIARRPATRVHVAWGPAGTEPLPGCVAVLFALERILHRVPVGRSQLLPQADFAHYERPLHGPPDAILDLTGTAEAEGVPVRRLTFDGFPGEAGALAALLEGRTPVLAVVDGRTGAPVASGRPGSETPHIVVAAFEEVLARATTLLLAALAGGAPALEDGTATSPPLACGSVARFGGKAIARAALHRLYRLLYRTPHWRVGWRFVDGPDAIDLMGHPAGGWRDLPDDGLRFYADPFPITVDGRTWLFMEDLEHRTGKGVISAVMFDEAGPVGRPEPVLEREAHLSYPFVLAEAGVVWMIPESSAAGTVDLFRARRFPGGWTHEATLLSGVEASDATPFRHGGRWWMTASVRDGGGSYSDALHLWSAEALTGPWAPHPANPVLVDVATARPAGRVVSRGGRLIRPVQDCRGGYGSGLALAEVTRLDEAGFEQRVVGRLDPGPLWPGRRLHTLNRAGRLECIDGSAFAPRFRAGSSRAGAA